MEHVVDRLPDGPAPVLRLGVDLRVGEPEERGDELSARDVVVGQELGEIPVAPALQEIELVAHAPDLSGVLLLVKDVVDEEVTRAATPGAAVGARLREILLGEVVERLQRLVERCLETLDERLDLDVGVAHAALLVCVVAIRPPASAFRG